MAKKRHFVAWSMKIMKMKNARYTNLKGETKANRRGVRVTRHIYRYRSGLTPYKWQKSSTQKVLVEEQSIAVISL